MRRTSSSFIDPRGRLNENVENGSLRQQRRDLKNEKDIRKSVFMMLIKS